MRFIVLFFLLPVCSLSGSLWDMEMREEDKETRELNLEDIMNFKNALASKKCVPCSGGVPPMKGDALTDLLKQLGDGWKVVEEHHLMKEYKFPDFSSALAFTNRVGAVAEKEGHHPDIYLAWGKVKIMIWTHKINGLTESDFILAAKCDEVVSP